MAAGSRTPRPSNPLSEATFFSRLAFLWASPLVNLGSSRPLVESDLPSLPPQDGAAATRARVKEAWDEERTRCEQHGGPRRSSSARSSSSRRRPSLFRALCRLYATDTIGAQILLVVAMAGRIGQAISLGFLLETFDNGGSGGNGDEGRDFRPAYLWSMSLVLCGLASFLCKQHQFFLVYRSGMRLRAGIVGCLFEKALTLPGVGTGLSGVGRTTNLASTDAERFQLASVAGIYLLWGPVEAIAIVTVSVFMIGPAFLAGFGLLVFVLVPLQIFLGRRFARLRSSVAALTDARLGAISQAVGGARVVKMQAWEPHFIRTISDLRRKEVKRIQDAGHCRALNEAIFFVTSIAVSSVVFALHVAMGGALTPRLVFTTLSLLNVVQQTVTKMIPNAIMGYAECAVSARRIQTFLEFPSLVCAGAIGTTRQLRQSGEGDPVVSFCDVTCHWDRQDDSSGSSPERLKGSVALHGISLQLFAGQLYFVLGKVGSGKSALLLALAGELPSSSGQIQKRKSSLAYAAQDAMIINGTIRENVAMGLPFREDHYKSVLEACGLLPDLKRLSSGDKTVVGDRGVRLSGGQRARVGLARALYCDADLILLDDPLSAVDAKIRRSIFLAIQRLCIDRGKCCVVATHYHEYAGDRHPCILMEQGRIESHGPLSKCMGKDGLSHMQGHDSVAIGNFSSDGDKLQPRDLDKDDSSPDDTVNGGATELHVEERKTGLVEKDTWFAYARAFGGTLVGLALCTTFVGAQALILVSIVVMGKWAEAEESAQNSPRWLGIVFGTICASTIASISRAYWSFSLAIAASRRLHERMLHSVLRATIDFYDLNPVGRILNRFSSDIGITDEVLPLTLYDFSVGFFMALGGIATASAVIPMILLVLPALFCVFLRLRRYFVATSRELKRLEGVARSPIYALLSEVLSGIITIRTNGASKYFSSKFEESQDSHTRAFFAFVSVSRWFAIRIDTISFILVALASFLSVIFDHQDWFNVEPAFLGLALSLLLQIAGTNFPWIVRQSAEIVNQMVSAERILSYCRLPSEKDWYRPVPDADLVEKQWPGHGRVELENLCVRYKPELPLALENVSLHIRPGQRFGIIGRSGGGKSTMIQALFRILEAESGAVSIDGVDTSQVGLHTLRTRMSLLSQDPFLFGGCTVKENLDPESKHSEENIRRALVEAQIDALVNQLEQGLDTVVSENGSNFSVGQKQLLCLARAILDKNKILVLDEPTANVDRQTDALLQEALLRSFRGSTIIAVAHRLETVIDYDCIAVVGDGKILECGAPAQLLERKDGYLSSMVSTSLVCKP